MIDSYIINLEKDKNGKSTGYLLLTVLTDPPTPPQKISVQEFIRVRSGVDPFEIAKTQTSSNSEGELN